MDNIIKSVDPGSPLRRRAAPGRHARAGKDVLQPLHYVTERYFATSCSYAGLPTNPQGLNSGQKPR